MADRGLCKLAEDQTLNMQYIIFMHHIHALIFMIIYFEYAYYARE